MKLKALTAAVLVGGMTLGTAAHAELSANIGFTSNYLWRGLTQTNDQAAISGGIDYAHESGFYAGAWASNVSWTGVPSTEFDTYIGFGGEFSGISYDIGYIDYAYMGADPADNEDFSEVYLGLGYDIVSFQYSNDSDNDNSYMELAVDIPLSDSLTLGIHYGDYSFDVSTSDYSDTSIGLTKSLKDDMEFGIVYSTTDLDEDPAATDDDARVVVSFAKSFGL